MVAVFILTVVLGVLVLTTPLLIVGYLVLDSMGVRWPRRTRKHSATGFEVVTHTNDPPTDLSPP